MAENPKAECAQETGQITAEVQASDCETDVKEERRAEMTNQERLMNALFEHPNREHVDIKFLLGGGIDVTSEDVCGEAVKALEQMDQSEGDREFAEDFKPREAAEFLASI
jgi:hypothetical protein